MSWAKSIVSCTMPCTWGMQRSEYPSCTFRQSRWLSESKFRSLPPYLHCSMKSDQQLPSSGVPSAEDSEFAQRQRADPCAVALYEWLEKSFGVKEARREAHLRGRVEPSRGAPRASARRRRRPGGRGRASGARPRRPAPRSAACR